MNWQSRATDSVSSRAMGALQTAEAILQRDGIQELRGTAWTDEELTEIQGAIRAMQQSVGGR